MAAIIQARLGSTRLPGKVLRSLAGRPMIEHIIKRVQAVNEIDAIVLAIPASASEIPLQTIAEQLGIECVQGAEEDVLGRFIHAGRFLNATHLVRICGDNPLTDIPLMASLVRRQLKENADYTFCPDSIPLGTGTEVIKLSALEKIALKTRLPIYREHVTTYFQDHPEEFHLERVPPPPYLMTGNFRLTVDTEKDFHLMDEIYQKQYSSTASPLNLENVMKFLTAHPKLASYNASVLQNNWRIEKNKKD